MAKFESFNTQRTGEEILNALSKAENSVQKPEFGEITTQLQALAAQLGTMNETLESMQTTVAGQGEKNAEFERRISALESKEEVE